MERFDGVRAQVLGISVDSVPCLKAWAESLGGISYPLLSDFYPHGETASAYGVLRPEGYSERAIFVIDKEGMIRYVDVHDIEEQPDNEELLRVLAELEPQPAGRQAAPAAVPTASPVDGAAESAQVTLYCTPWCPACWRARTYLREKGISFREVDISKDREAARKVRGWAGGYETTPTFEIGDQIVVDFNKSSLEAIFGG